MRRISLLSALLLMGNLRLGLLFRATGTQRKHGHDAQAVACFTALARSSDPYFRAEGFWVEQWSRANDEFRLATQPADSKAHYKVRWGLLLHERFNNADAAGLFREALQKDPRMPRHISSLRASPPTVSMARPQHICEKPLPSIPGGPMPMS
jgi:hypothetical protein